VEAISLPIYSTEGKKIDTLKLNSAVFDGKINNAAIYQTINAYRANQRKGLASTKTRKDVSGGGAKPWRQKGTGRARVGSIRSPLWRHGGVVFGPQPRDFSYKLPAKIKTLGLKSSINAKIKDCDVIILDEVKLGHPKTKELNTILFNLKLRSSGNRPSYNLLLLLDNVDNNLKVASRNIRNLDINKAADTHAYEILAHQKLIITKEGLSVLANRLK